MDGDGYARHILHREVRPPRLRLPRIEHLGDARWSMSASACLSSSNRAMTWCVSIPA
jgi:hypothetical protein